MPRIEIEVRRVLSGRISKEEYVIDEEDYEKWASDTIKKFNATLREGESPRELVGVVLLDEVETSGDHDWDKKNLVTIVRGSQSYDIYRCERCGITGKRHGLSQTIVRDHRYRGKKYERCTTKDRGRP